MDGPASTTMVWSGGASGSPRTSDGKIRTSISLPRFVGGGVEPSATSAHAFYLSPQTSGHECPPDRSTPTYDRDFPLLSPAPKNYAKTPGCPVPFTPPASASPPPPPPAQSPADPSNPKFDATHDTGNSPLPPWLPDDIAPGRYVACLCGAEEYCGYRAMWGGGVSGSCLGANPPPSPPLVGRRPVHAACARAHTRAQRAVSSHCGSTSFAFPSSVWPRFAPCFRAYVSLLACFGLPLRFRSLACPVG